MTHNQIRPQDLLAELKARFPWLGTDESVDGADVIDTLNQWYEMLESHAR